jgi:hypothetical protein
MKGVSEDDFKTAGIVFQIGIESNRIDLKLLEQVPRR